jgi:hypothetical protein
MLLADQAFTALELEFFRRGDECNLEAERALFGQQNSLVSNGPLIVRSSPV